MGPSINRAFIRLSSSKHAHVDGIYDAVCFGRSAAPDGDPCGAGGPRTKRFAVVLQLPDLSAAPIVACGWNGHRRAALHSLVGAAIREKIRLLSFFG